MTDTNLNLTERNGHHQKPSTLPLKKPDLLSLKEYTTIAEKFLNWYLKSRPHFFRKILYTDENITYVVKQLIDADISWNPEKGRSRRNYRAVACIWAIRNIVNKKRSNKTVSLEQYIENEDGDKEKIYSALKSPELSPIDYAVINETIDNANLNDRQKEILFLHYYDGLGFEEIGKMYGITRQRAHQIVSQINQKLARKQGF